MLKRKKKSPEEIAKNREDIVKRNEFFLKIWRKREKNNRHYSEVSNTPIYGECKSIYLHHILPKNKYPEAEFDEENIIILEWSEHDNVEMNMYKYEEINKRREQLKIKYGLN